MSQTILEALDKIANRRCCCGSGGIPGDDVIEPGPTNPGNPITQTPPPGFNTWSEYQTYKCKAANKIVDDLIATCNSLTSIPGVTAGLSTGLLYFVIQAAFFGTGSTGVASVLVGVIGLGLSATATIAIVITALVSLIVIGGAGLAYFATLATNISNSKADFVCALFNAESVEYARSEFETLLDGVIDGGWGDSVSDLVNKVITTLMGNQVYNLLFTNNSDISTYVGNTDCAGCGGCTYLPFVGVGINLSNGNYKSVFSSTDSRQWLTLQMTCGGLSDSSLENRGEVTISNLNVSYPLGTASNSGYRLYSKNNVILYQSNNPPPLPFEGVYTLILAKSPTSSNSFFEVSFSYE